MDLKNIIVDSKEVGKLVGLAKRSFTTAKTRTIKVVVDKIEDYENEYFAEDTELAKLVKAKQELDKETKKQKKELDSQILEKINTTLRTKRGYDAEELYEKRETALLELLKDALHEFDSHSGLMAYDAKNADGTLNTDAKGAWELNWNPICERLENIIKDMEEGMI